MSSRYGYLIHLLAWTLPVIALQSGVLWWRYRQQTPAILRAIAPPVFVIAAYLSMADHFAISAGVWRFPPGTNVGVFLGAVPIEEVLFFIVTNILVALGITLLRELTRRPP
jgi:lycopene cyclase domain-containing protein